MTERIAFIGFGEAGQTIGRGLLAQVAASGASYVDVAVMAPVAPYDHKVPCLIGAIRKAMGK